ncbi:MAG: Protein TolB [Pseudomonadota bacterium]
MCFSLSLSWMSMSHRSYFLLFLRWFALVGALMAGLPVQAQFRVEVTGVGMTRIPVVLVPLRGQAAVSQKISDIVQADLERSGQFKGLDAVGSQLDELSTPDANVWRQRGADALVAGSMTRLADGRYDIRARLWDIVTGQEKSAFKDTVTVGDLRLSAHRMADWIFQQLTGTPGVFATRIAYVAKSAGRYNLWVADADGEGARMALTSPEPIISPSWSPSGDQLAYVSFELHKPVIFVHELSTGKRRVVANFKGSNSAPGWSPDGRSLVATLSRSGGSQIYQVALQGGEPRRLQQSSGIDTEPVYTPDGSQIFFVSDRGGSPQIYRMPASGGAAERVTFNGSYNISPAISPDGRWMAFVSRNGGQFKVHVMDLTTGLVSPISDTTSDERPSFAPNSKMLIYATIVQGRESLVTSTLDGRVKARLAGQNGDIREPGWGPMRK